MSVAKTGIHWTDSSWNPIRGCTRVSEGCRHCFAERIAARFSDPGEQEDPGVWLRKPGPFHGFATRIGGDARWTGRVELIPDALDQPLRWNRPRRIFVNSMSDLFHEGLSNEAIAAVFGVMAAAQRHTFQVLTKRPERMLEWSRWVMAERDTAPAGWCFRQFTRPLMAPGLASAASKEPLPAWPLPNVWLGVSAEDQATLDARAPDLLRCPAAVRWVSLEPQIGPIRLFPCDCPRDYPPPDGPHNKWCQAARDAIVPRLDWIVQGGESGPRARPFNVAWARSVRDQCKAAGVAFFLKQLGARPAINPMEPWGDLRDRSGSDPDEWPEDLRVREFPEVRR